MPKIFFLLVLIFFNGAVFTSLTGGVDFFGNTFGFFKTDTFSDEIIQKGRLYIYISFLVFALGLWRGTKKNFKPKVGMLNDIVKNRLFGLLFLVLSSLGMIILILRGVDYNAYTSGGASLERFFIPLGIVGISSLLLNRRKNIIFILAYSIICFLFTIKVGARAEGLINLSPILLWKLWKNPKISYILAPVFVFGFLFVVSFVRIARDGEMGLYTVSDALTFVFIEGGFTSNLVLMAMEYVDTNGYAYGLNYLGALVSIFPKLAFWMANSENSYSMSSALGFYYDKGLILSGFGLGSSIIAESFFSAGWFGFIFIYLYAYVSMRLCSHPSKSEYISYLALCSFGYFLFGIRQDFTFVVRGIVWYSILPALISLFFVKFYKGRKRGDF